MVILWPEKLHPIFSFLCELKPHHLISVDFYHMTESEGLMIPSCIVALSLMDIHALFANYLQTSPNSSFICPNKLAYQAAVPLVTEPLRRLN